MEAKEIKIQNKSQFNMIPISDKGNQKRDDLIKMRRLTLQPIIKKILTCTFRSFSSCNLNEMNKPIFDKKEEDLFKTASLIM